MTRLGIILALFFLAMAAAYWSTPRSEDVDTNNDAGDP